MIRPERLKVHRIDEHNGGVLVYICRPNDIRYVTLGGSVDVCVYGLGGREAVREVDRFGESGKVIAKYFHVRRVEIFSSAK